MTPHEPLAAPDFLAAPGLDDIVLSTGSAPIAGSLRQVRQAAGLSISELASAAGTSRAAVYAYENGDRDPTISTAIRLLRGCGATLSIAAVAAE